MWVTVVCKCGYSFIESVAELPWQFSAIDILSGFEWSVNTPVISLFSDIKD